MSHDYGWVYPTVFAILSAILSWFNRQKIKEVEKTFNSKMDRLIKLEMDKARAEGRASVFAEQAESDRIREKDRPRGS